MYLVSTLCIFVLYTQLWSVKKYKNSPFANRTHTHTLAVRARRFRISLERINFTRWAVSTRDNTITGQTLPRATHPNEKKNAQSKYNIADITSNRATTKNTYKDMSYHK